MIPAQYSITKERERKIARDSAEQNKHSITSKPRMQRVIEAPLFMLKSCSCKFGHACYYGVATPAQELKLPIGASCLIMILEQ